MSYDTRVIEVRIPSEFGYEKMVTKLATAVAEQMGFETDRLEDLSTAVAEACLNAIEHGNQSEPGALVLVRFIVDIDRLTIDVHDEGRGGPPPEDFPEPDITLKMTGREEPRRMGIHVIRQLVDKAGFVDPAPDGGSRFRLVMYLRRQG